jgi:tetratricopeptide (TPR) repeat protein
MLDQSRIDELRRRIDLDPTSIAFAELAEEYRKAGRHADAVSLCRTGLARHPAYLSARVTLGRALTALNDLRSAQAELEQVLKVASTSLPALRALADVFERRNEPELARALLEQAARLAVAAGDPALEDEEDEEDEADEAGKGGATAEGVELAAPMHTIGAIETVEPIEAVEQVEPTEAGPCAQEVADERSPQLRALEGFLSRIELESRRRDTDAPIA